MLCTRRIKYSDDNDKASLSAVQEAFLKIVNEIKREVLGLISIQRVIDWTNKEFRVIITLSANRFAEWEEDQFQGPEALFLRDVAGIPGVMAVDASSYGISNI